MPPADTEDGERVGRFVLLRDTDGTRHAVTATAVTAICEVDGGSLLLLPGGRMLRVEQALATVLGWFEMGHRT